MASRDSAPDDVEPVFAKITRTAADGVVFGAGSLLFNLRASIGAAGLAHKLPALAYVAEEVPSSVLMSLGRTFPIISAAQQPHRQNTERRKPADLPVQAADQIQAAAQSKTAKALASLCGDAVASAPTR